MMTFDFICVVLVGLIAPWGLVDSRLPRGIRVGCGAVAAGALLNAFDVLNRHFIWIEIAPETIWPGDVLLHAGVLAVMVFWLLFRYHRRRSPV